MKRRRQVLQVSTFPFLAVLLCTMGSLILLLLAIDRRAKAVARAKAASALAQAAEQDTRSEAARKAEWERRRRALHALLVQEDQDLLGKVQHLKTKIGGHVASLQEVESHYRALRDKLLGEKARLVKGRQILGAELAATGKITQQEKAARKDLARLNEELDQLEQTLRDLKLLRQRDQQTYSLVPYRGRHGDDRRPIYLECRSNALVFHPEHVVLRGPQVTIGTVLAEVQRQIARQREEVIRAGGKKDATPYLLMLVRPDGILTYYRVLASLQGLEYDFGYEFVEGDWVLDFSEGENGSRSPWKTASQSIAAPEHPAPGWKQPPARGAPPGFELGRPGARSGIVLGKGGLGYPGPLGTGQGLLPGSPGGGNNPSGVIFSAAKNGPGVGVLGGDGRGEGGQPGGGTSPGNGSALAQAGPATGGSGGGNSPGGSGGAANSNVEPPGSGGGNTPGANGRSGVPGSLLFGNVGGPGTVQQPVSDQGSPGNLFNPIKGVSSGPVDSAPRGTGWPGGVGVPASLGTGGPGTGSASGTAAGQGTSPAGSAVASGEPGAASGTGTGGGTAGHGRGPASNVSLFPSPGSNQASQGGSIVLGKEPAQGGGSSSTASGTSGATSGSSVPSDSGGKIIASSSPAGGSGSGSSRNGSRAGSGSGNGGGEGTGTPGQSGGVSPPPTGGSGSGSSGNGSGAGTGSSGGGGEGTGTPGQGGGGSSPPAVAARGGRGSSTGGDSRQENTGSSGTVGFAPRLPGGEPPRTVSRPWVPTAQVVGNRDWIIPIECTPEAVIVRIARVQLPAATLAANAGPDNPLAQVVRQLIERRQAGVRPGEPLYRPRIRFLVRPSGGRSYYLAYPLLEGLGVPMVRQDLEEEKPRRPREVGP